MKYRIKTGKAMYRSEFGHHWAREYFDVQRKVLFFFWYTIKGFWERDAAEEYLDALIEVEKSGG
jgi:hypothetical protein